MTRIALLVALAGCWPAAPSPPPAKPTAIKHVAVAEVIVDAVPAPTELAVDATHVYVIGGAAIWSARKEPNARFEKLASVSHATGLALDAAYVWWGDTGGVFRVPKQGGAVEQITHQTQGVAAFARAGNELVIAEPDNESTNVIVLTADGVVVDRHLIEGRSPKVAIAAAGFYAATDRVIVRVGRDHSIHTLLDGPLLTVEALVVASERPVYAAAGQLFAVSEHRTDPIGAAPVGDTHALAVDAARIWWSGDQGAIYWLWVAGGTPQLFERLGPNAYAGGIAIDGDDVYWSNTESGQILRKRRD